MFDENINTIEERQEYRELWQDMAKDNQEKLKKFPAGTWMVNADSLTANTIFKMDKKHEIITPYNIKGSVSLSIRENDGLVYAESYKYPVFFDYVDSTKRYSITTADGLIGFFRKAMRPDLSMGHYTNVPGNNLNYSGYEKLIIYSGKAFFHGTVQRIKFEDEKLLGYLLEGLSLSDIARPLYHRSKSSRSGCYDYWGFIDDNFDMKFMWKRVMEEGARNFLFIFGKEKSEWEINENYSTVSNTRPVSSGSLNWDQLLDSYEQYVDKCLALIEKVKNGDKRAQKEVESLLEKAEDLSDKLSEADDDLSTEQYKRYMSISQKMLSVATSLY